jgi:hypothetical protein
MSRTPYSPFVLNATAPLPWKLGRVAVAVIVGSGTGGVLRRSTSIPSDFVGIEV